MNENEKNVPETEEEKITENAVTEEVNNENVAAPEQAAENNEEQSVPEAEEPAEETAEEPAEEPEEESAEEPAETESRTVQSYEGYVPVALTHEEHKEIKHERRKKFWLSILAVVLILAAVAVGVFLTKGNGVQIIKTLIERPTEETEVAEEETTHKDSEIAVPMIPESAVEYSKGVISEETGNYESTWANMRFKKPDGFEYATEVPENELGAEYEFYCASETENISIAVRDFDEIFTSIQDYMVALRDYYGKAGYEVSDPAPAVIAEANYLAVSFENGGVISYNACRVLAGKIVIVTVNAAEDRVDELLKCIVTCDGLDDLVVDPVTTRAETTVPEGESETVAEGEETTVPEETTEAETTTAED